MTAQGHRGRSEGRHSTSQQRAAFVVMCVGYFLVLLDVPIVNVALFLFAATLTARYIPATA